MKGKELLISHLQLFDENRKKGFDVVPSQRLEYSNAIAKCFLPCAQYILAGCFKVYSGNTKRTIRPTAIELYYHEEGTDGFKDPIMYHTQDRKAQYLTSRGITMLPYFPVGSMNPHTSGIDITFENPSAGYRASFLIREYELVCDDGNPILVKNSTDIYDDLLINGITLDDADWIEWCDGKLLPVDMIERKWRRNVPDYRPKEDDTGKWEPNPNGVETFSTAKGRFAKCPFNWQFKVKKTGSIIA